MNKSLSARKALTPAIPILHWLFRRVFDNTILIDPEFVSTFVGYRALGLALWRQRILGFNRSSPWPIAITTRVSDYTRLHMHPEDIARNLSSPGCYYQNFDADIFIGRGSYIAPNVGIITSNHVPEAPSSHAEGHDIRIGENCWIGMNSVILPGVRLGDFTTVGAGSVVTRSFPNGNCVLAGSPARIIRSS